VLAVGLGVVVALALAATASVPAILDVMGGFRWRLAPAVLAAVGLNWVLRFLKWHYYVRRLAIPLPWWPSLLVFVSGFTMAISPGKLGEVLKALLVRNLVGTEVSRTVSIVMAERLTDVAGLLALSALGATALPHGPWLVGGLAVAFTLAVVLFRVPALGGPARRLLPARVVEPLRLFVQGGRALLAPGALAIGVGLSIVSWLFECLAFGLILSALSVPLPLRVATFLYAFSSLAGAVSMLPGGLGVAEGSLAALLAGFGTPLPAAAAATLLIRLSSLWLAVALGMLTLLCAFRGVLARGPART